MAMRLMSDKLNQLQKHQINQRNVVIIPHPTTMKTSIKSLTTSILAAMAFVALCGTARADLSVKTATAYPGGGTSWALNPNGQTPFYSSGDLATSGNFSARGPAGPSGSATVTVLAETITITNGAGVLGLGSPLVVNTNYVLTGISMLISGYDSTHPLSLHIFDVTSNLTGGGVIASSAGYNFTANGDLLGGGNGLSWTNATLSGAEQQVYFGLQNGPTTYGDQVVLASNHTYAVEVWIPTIASGAFNWWKSSSTPQDLGGEAMAGTDASLSVARITGSAGGFYGSSQHGFALALYGSPTSAAPSVNNNTNAVPMTNYVVDNFSPAGVGPQNPINYDYYSSSNNYASGQITNVYGNWFGGAFQSLAWDSTSDADNNTNSGSLMISLNFSSTNSQFVVWDQGTANNYFALNVNATIYTNFQCDVRFAAGSASDSGTYGSPIFGHLRFGDRTSSYGQDWFGSVDIAASNTNWVHVSIPLNAVTDQNLTNIQGLLIGLDRVYYGLNLNGASTLWVDNIKFVGPATVVVPPPPAPPTLSIQKATPALRIFAGSSANTYDRAELATIDQSQSWIGGAYPVSYSFTLLSYPANINQTHIFLVPVNSMPLGNNMYNNEFVDFQASNGLWLVLGPNGGGRATASVLWKTNLPSANPDHTALFFTNSTAIGTWTLTFTGPSVGTVTGPGGSPVSFTITNGTVATDFANPVVAYFGLQPNSGAGMGQYEDWASISVAGVAGVNESDNFTTDTSFNNSGIWSINTATVALNTCVQLVTTNTPYWINWTLPAVGYGLGTAMDVLGNTNTSNPWMLPEYYNGYNGSPTGNDLPGQANQGSKTWVLIPSTCLPTVDGSQGGVPSPNAFFRLVSPPLQN
jgi:hypothetical protein